MWAGVEPDRGQYNASYLKAVQEIVEEAPRTCGEVFLCHLICIYIHILSYTLFYPTRNTPQALYPRHLIIHPLFTSNILIYTIYIGTMPVYLFIRNYVRRPPTGSTSWRTCTRTCSLRSSAGRASPCGLRSLSRCPSPCLSACPSRQATSRV